MNETHRAPERWGWLLLLGGLVAVAIGFALHPSQAWGNLLLAGWALATCGLAGVFLLAVSYPLPDGRQRWLWTSAAGLTALLPWGAAVIGLVLLAAPGLYAWTSVDRATLTPFQAIWLSRGFFLLRAVVYLAAWLAFARVFRRLTAARLATPTAELRAAHARWTAGFAYVLAVTLWLASYDWLMSLEAPWSSTIFGMYAFAGLLAAGLALVTLDAVRRGAAPDRLHDLGQALLAASCLWVYLWFCQFLLIWYVNLPEETVWFTRRLAGTWGMLFYLNVGLNWVLPFLVLLPRESKRSSYVLAKVAGVVLLGRWLDLYLLIGPPAIGGQPRQIFAELAVVALVAGAVLLRQRAEDGA